MGFNNGVKGPDVPDLVIFLHASEHSFINFNRSWTVLHCRESCLERDASSTTEEREIQCTSHTVSFTNE